MTHRVVLQPSGHSFDTSGEQYVLTDGLAAGFNLPYSCRVGMCRSCRGRLLDGQVEMSDYLPHVLTPEMRAQNFILLCRSQARTNLTIEIEELKLQTIKPKVVPCRVKRIEHLAPDIAIIDLRLPQNENMRFLAGQYVEVLLANGVRRAYSIANAPKTDGVIDLQIHVRHSPGGLFTDHVFSSMKERDLLKFEGPLGTFCLREDTDKPIVLLASGTGLAPIKSIIEYAMARKIARPMTLYWGCRTRSDLYMQDLATRWAQEIPGFSFVPVLSDATAADAWMGRTGLVHRAVTDDLADLSGHEVYASGNPAMIDAARLALTRDNSLPESAFFADAFVTEAHRAVPRAEV